MANQNLHQANKAKKNEFYTQYDDIQREINAYLEFNPDVFRGKTVLLPCDDPEWSNFTKFFAKNFEYMGLKKLISTSYAFASKDGVPLDEPTLFERQSPLFNKDIHLTHGKVFVLDKDTNGNGHIDIDDLQWSYLTGDGDFRSQEVCALRDEADIIVTNPPFSLFREFLAWLEAGKKQFIMIGHINAITYKEVFKLIKDNRIWTGQGFNLSLIYKTPYPNVLEGNRKYVRSKGFDPDKGYVKVPGICWFTNLDHGRRHQPLQLMSLSDNIRFSKHNEIRGIGYQTYDNYEAIEVPFTDAIPCDYQGVMGVPISFLDKYCPEQFEIVKFRKGEDNKDLSIRGVCPYFRILIRKKG